MNSIRHWALVAGFTCGAAFWLVACGGGDDVAPTTPVEPPAPAAEESPEARLDAIREKAIAELGEEHRANFEDTENGDIRYSGETENGEPFIAQMGGDVDVPEGFFDEIPMYPDAVPFSMMQAGAGMTMVSIESEDSPPDVYEFYKAKLEETGWVLENDITVSGGRILRALKSSRRATLHIQATDSGTRVGYALSDEG